MAIIGVRWGTTALDAALIDADGIVRDACHQVVRLRDATRESIVATLTALAARWPDAGKVVLAGMIGSAAGWREIAHRACPLALDGRSALQEELVGSLRCAFVPGLISRDGREPDFLRGEEVLAAGRLREIGMASELLLAVPGMHGKWIALDGGRITRFHSAMTVELATLMCSRSTLARPEWAAPTDGPVFRDAVRRGATGDASARLLFGTRTGLLSGRLTAATAASEIWGVLIGADIADARRLYDAAMPSRITVTGAPDAARLFAAALDELGLSAQVENADRLAGLGFVALAQ